MSAMNGEEAVSLDILGPGLNNALNDDKGVEGKHIRERAGQIEQVLHKRELRQPLRKGSMPFIGVGSRESTDDDDDDDDENDDADENYGADKHGWRLHSIEPRSSLQFSGSNAEIVEKPGQKNELNKGMAFPVFIDMSTVPKPTVSKSDELRRLREKKLVKRISLVFEGKPIEHEVKETGANNVVEQPPAPEIRELSVSFDGLKNKEELHASRKVFVVQCLLVMTIFVAAFYIIRRV